MTAVRSASCSVCKREELVAGLGGLERAGGRLARGDQRDICVRLVSRFCTDAGLDAHGVLQAGERVLPARLRVGDQLLRRSRAANSVCG